MKVGYAVRGNQMHDGVAPWPSKSVLFASKCVVNPGVTGPPVFGFTANFG
jgi:hypothetical protein